VSFTDELDRQRRTGGTRMPDRAGRGLVTASSTIACGSPKRRSLVRCRSDDDTGVRVHQASDIRLVRFDGSAVAGV